VQTNCRTINRNRRHWASFALSAVAILLGLLALAKVTSLSRGTARARDLAAFAVARDDRDPNRLQRHLADAKGAAEALKKKNLFIGQPPRENPVKQVEGILGSEALISGKWYKVGEKIGDAQILAIGPTEVKIEWDGKSTTFSPMAAVSAGPSSPPRPEGGLKQEKGPASPKPPAEVQAAPTEASAAPVVNDPLAWLGVELPARVKEKMLEHWNRMSDQEKEEAKQKWNTMSEEQKRQAAQSMEQGIQ